MNVWRVSESPGGLCLYSIWSEVNLMGFQITAGDSQGSCEAPEGKLQTLHQNLKFRSSSLRGLLEITKLKVNLPQLKEVGGHFK